MIFDSHAHYDDSSFDMDRNEVLLGMKEKRVACIVNVAADIKGNEDTLELMESYDFLYGAFGIHPNHADQLNEKVMADIEVWCQHRKCVAVGETGLDYYYQEPARELQQIWFRKQIDLAKKIQKPLIIHSREAAADTLAILKESDASSVGGVIHCFSYGKEMAKEFIDLGFMIGIGGVLTFKNGKKLKEVVESIPLESIVLETDCPYLAPSPFRGKRNDSSLIAYVIEEVANIKNLSIEEVEKQTWKNARAQDSESI